MSNFSINLPVYNSFGAVVGQINGKTLRKTAWASKHMLRKPPGWAWDIDILRQAEKLGVGTVEIHDHETGNLYCTPLALLWEKGRELDRGYGRQWMLPLHYWHIEGAAIQPVLFETAT